MNGKSRSTVSGEMKFNSKFFKTCYANSACKVNGNFRSAASGEMKFKCKLFLQIPHEK